MMSLPRKSMTVKVLAPSKPYFVHFRWRHRIWRFGMLRRRVKGEFLSVWLEHLLAVPQIAGKA